MNKSVRACPDETANSENTEVGATADKPRDRESERKSEGPGAAPGCFYFRFFFLPGDFL